MITEAAGLSDLPHLLRFRTDAAKWLAEGGTDQWSSPFPSDHMRAGIEAIEVFLIREDDHACPASTVTLDRQIDPELWELWTQDERDEPALYVHKLIVGRRYAGCDLGGRILDCAARQGARWLRLDAWTTNVRLQQYHLEHGFQHVCTTKDPDEVSGWLAQRSLYRVPHGFDYRVFLCHVAGSRGIHLWIRQ